MRRGYADTATGQLHYRERPGDGPAIVFLHQTPSSSLMWERVMAAYPAGRRLLALDTPGFGLSDRPDALPEDGITHYARAILEALDDLGADRFDVVGIHTGAVIATEIGARAPDRVGRLVLIGMLVITPEEGGERMDDAHGRSWEPDRRGDYLRKQLVPAMAARVTTDDADHFHDELMSVMQAGPEWWWGYNGVFSYDARARLPLVSSPTLVAVADGDEPAMFGWSELAAQLAQDGEYRVLPDMTNEMAFEAPDRVVELVDGFVGSGAS
jgi:pimeloyl-ACP methyl ester carboxylesterase